MFNFSEACPKSFEGERDAYHHSKAGLLNCGFPAPQLQQLQVLFARQSGGNFAFNFSPLPTVVPPGSGDIAYWLKSQPASRADRLMFVFGDCQERHCWRQIFVPRRLAFRIASYPENGRLVRRPSTDPEIGFLVRPNSCGFAQSDFEKRVKGLSSDAFFYAVQEFSAQYSDAAVVARHQQSGSHDVWLWRAVAATPEYIEATFIGT